jgi:hypothetical protein
MGAINLADPDFEPSDTQLEELAVKAFAHVKAAREASLQELRARIEAARREALAALHAADASRTPK